MTSSSSATSSMTSSVISRSELNALRSALTAGAFIDDTSIITSYSSDKSHIASNEQTPLALVRAANRDDVQETMRFCSAHGIPVVPRGAGTGVSGGVAPLAGSIILSLEKFKEITIDPVAKVAYVGPGVLNGELKRAAAEYGLWYPPDPSSFEICSIGGNVNTNAGGLCCVKYGVTIDYILGLEVVLADGRLITVGGARIKDVAGYSLTKLFVGSEGTLGIVTRVICKLVPRSLAYGTVVAEMPDAASAVQAVVDITTHCQPSTLEFMDNRSVNIVEDDIRMGLNRAVGSLLIMQTDHGGTRGDTELEMMQSIVRQHGAGEVYFTTDPAEAELFLEARRRFFLSAEKLGDTLYEDVGVPLPHLPVLVEKIAELSATSGLIVAVVAHAGDANTHPVIVFNRHDREQVVAAEQLYARIMEIALELQGTITGEHGVGRSKAPWLQQYLGTEVYELNKQIKTLFDPQGILNPGVMFT